MRDKRLEKREMFLAIVCFCYNHYCWAIIDWIVIYKVSFKDIISKRNIGILLCLFAKTIPSSLFSNLCSLCWICSKTPHKCIAFRTSSYAIFIMTTVLVSSNTFCGFQCYSWHQLWLSSCLNVHKVYNIRFSESVLKQLW